MNTTEVTETRKNQAQKLLDFMKTGTTDDHATARYLTILAQVQEAERKMAQIELKPEIQNPLVDEAWLGIEFTLKEARSAALRGFLFQVPEKQERAFNEIETRLDIFLWMLSDLEEVN